MFTPGGRIFLLEDSLNELNLMIPHNQSFKNLSGNIAVEKLNKNLFLISIFFLIFMIFYFFLSLFSLFKIFKGNEKKLFFYLVLTAQMHLIAVAFLNIGSFRYVMPVYSIIIFTTLFLNYFFFDLS